MESDKSYSKASICLRVLNKLALENLEKPGKPRKIKDILEEKDFVPYGNRAMKEFRELENVDQQRHVLRYRQELGKKYAKSNRYKARLPNKRTIYVHEFSFRLW